MRDRRQGLLTALALAGVAVAALEPTLHFDWWAAFRNASALENPQGFADPTGYLFTRLEGLCEVARFLGPLVVGLVAFGLRSAPKWARHGLILWGAMLLAGAFKTGETARACLFVLPCILGVVASVPVEPRHLRLVTVALFAQATVMQWFGDSLW